MPFVQWMETLLLRMKGAYLYRIIYVLYMLLDVMSVEAMSLTSVLFGNRVCLDKPVFQELSQIKFYSQFY